MFSKKLERIPPYILAKVTEAMKAARARGEDVVDFGMGNPDMPTPPHIVEKLLEAAPKSQNHRYSVSRGVFKLREAICLWYQRRFGVTLDPDTEAIATIGAKEGISHFMLALLNPGDTVLVPTPCYPIHAYSVILSEGNVLSIPFHPGEDLFPKIEAACKQTWPKPKAIILSYPHNPTGATVELSFFERVVELARQENLLVIHDHAYAELCFDGFRSPSLLQVPGAKELGVEFYSLSKTYNMPGWRIGFMVGNREAVAMLARIKSYLDYGMFAPTSRNPLLNVATKSPWRSSNKAIVMAVTPSWPMEVKQAIFKIFSTESVELSSFPILKSVNRSYTFLSNSR